MRNCGRKDCSEEDSICNSSPERRKTGEGDSREEKERRKEKVVGEQWREGKEEESEQ